MCLHSYSTLYNSNGLSQESIKGTDNQMIYAEEKLWLVSATTEGHMRSDKLDQKK